MTSYVPVVKNGAGGAIIYIGLVDQANTKLLKANPTLATGDVKISIDGGALANLGTLPTVTPAAGRQVKVILSQAETNGDNLTVQFVDAAGAEWCDLLVNIQTAAKQFDDLPTLEQIWGASVGLMAGVSDSFGQAIAEIWARVGAYIDVAISSRSSLDAAGVRSAVGLGSANLDTQLGAIDAKTTNLPSDPADQSLIIAATNALGASIAALPTAAQNADAVWDEATSGHVTPGSTGKALTDAGGFGTPLTAQEVSDAVWAISPGMYASVSDSMGERMILIDAAISSRQAETMIAEFTTTTYGAQSITAPNGFTLEDDWATPALIVIYSATTGAKTSNIVTSYDGATRTFSMQAPWPVTLSGPVVARIYPYGLDPASDADLQSTVAAAIAAADIPGAVWGYSVSLVAGVSDSFGQTINEIRNGLSVQADPWSTALPGAYAAGTAGFILGTYLNATISSRMATFSYTAPDNAGILAAIAALPTAVANADALLGRNIAGGSNGGRTVKQAIYFLRNYWTINQITGLGTVYEIDDTTPSWTFQTASDAAASPIVSSNPTS